MFLKNYLKSRKSYTPANSQRRAPCGATRISLLKEFQNLIRKHFHSSLSSNPKCKELDKKNVDLIIFMSAILFFYRQFLFTQKKIKVASELLNSKVAAFLWWLSSWLNLQKSRNLYFFRTSHKDSITNFTVYSSLQSLKQSQYAYL